MIHSIVNHCTITIVLRLRNVDLRFLTKEKFTFQIIRVMSERHPSRAYTAELERRFKDAEGVFVQSHPAEVSWRSRPVSAPQLF